MIHLVTVSILLFPPFPRSEAPAPTASATDSDTIVLNAAGDVAYPNGWRGIDEIDAKQHRLFEQVRPILDGGDLNFANIECPMTNVVPRVKKTYPIACEPKRMSYVIDGGFNMFSLANNHSLDCGAEGVTDTLALLAKLTTPERPLYWAGTGTTPEEAAAPRLIALPGKKAKIAFFAVSNSGNRLVDGLHSPTLDTRIAEAAKRAEIVVVSVHSGPEYIHVPTETAVKRYHALIDAGADVVLGHHPHVVQGVERHGRGVIYYSLGNFSFGSRTVRHKETGARLYSMIGRIVFKGGEVAVAEVVPLYANNSEPWTVDGQTLQPIHAVPQLLKGVFAREALREFQGFTAKIPGGSPTRLRVTGDTAVVEAAR